MIVVVVDDEAFIRALVESLLQVAGHEVLPAHDVDTGLELARRHRPQLIITDIAMPGRTGLELIREVRADAELSGTRILAITGHMPREASAAGADAVLKKPFQAKELLQEIARLI